MEEKNVTDERLRRRDFLLPPPRARSVSRDTVFSQHPETGDNAPLTRKELRERERQAEQAAQKQHSAKHPVEAPVAPVLADLFTPRTVTEPVEVQAVAVEAAAAPLAGPVAAHAQPEAAHAPIAAAEVNDAAIAEPAATLPSRRSMRNKQAAAVVPAVPAALVSAAPSPTAMPVVSAAVDPLDIFGLTVTNIESVSAPVPASVTPIVVQPATPATRKRSKPGKAAKTARAPKSATAPTAPRSRKATSSTVKSKRVWVSRKALAPSSSSASRSKRSASKTLSFVAMLFAFPILVGVSVPSNVFMNTDSAVVAAGAPAADLAALSANARTTQSLAVSDDVQSEVAAHDNIKVISYAEVLALKYAGISYEYSATTGAVRWPFPYSVPITDGFGDRIGGFHKGTDFAAASGTPIYAIADGTVELIQADWSGYGYHAIISHTINGQQVKSLYAHMITDSSPIVVGQEIKAGDFIGLVGETGIAYGAHLHFEIHLDDVPVDPYAWLTANAVN